MKPLWPSAVLLLAALSLTAGESEPTAPAVDRQAISQLFTRLRDGFLSGNHRMVRALLTARTEAENELLERQAEAVRTEFKKRSYSVFQVRDWSVDEALGENRVDVWVQLHTVCSAYEGDARYENFHNDAFLLERQPDGAYLIVDSPFFQTVGHQQGVGLIADALLVAMGCLVALVFWVWMGFEAFTRRPRRPGWRTCVMLVPLLGALAFFVVVYLPGLVRRASTRTAAGA